MGWSFNWASSYESDFNSDFEHSRTREEASEWVPKAPPIVRRTPSDCGTDPAGYMAQRPGLSVFALQDGEVYLTYATTARGLEVGDDLLRHPRPDAAWPRRGRARPIRRGCAATTSSRRREASDDRARDRAPGGVPRRPRRGRRGRPRRRRRRLARPRRADGRHGHRARRGPGDARLVCRHLGGDDGGDDAAGAAPAVARLVRAGGAPAPAAAVLFLLGYGAVWMLAGTRRLRARRGGPRRACGRAGLVLGGPLRRRRRDPGRRPSTSSPAPSAAGWRAAPRRTSPPPRGAPPAPCARASSTAAAASRAAGR